MRSTRLVIELCIKLFIRTTQLQLNCRRVLQDIAILVLAVLDHRRIERLNDITRQIRLEPQLTVLYALVNHELVKCLQLLLQQLDVRTLVSTAKRQIHRILRRTKLVSTIQAKWRTHVFSRLHRKGAPIIVQPRALRSTLQCLRGSNRNVLHVKFGGLDNGHLLLFEALPYLCPFCLNQFLFPFFFKMSYFDV